MKIEYSKYKRLSRKTWFWLISLFAVFSLGLWLGGRKHVIEICNEYETVAIPTFYKIPEDATLQTLRNIKITAYTNRVEETDDTPNVTATNRPVGEGTIAISQDLWGSKIKRGDIVCIHRAIDPKTGVGRCYHAEDVMHSRWTRRMDIFTYDKLKASTMNVNSDITVIHFNR